MCRSIDILSIGPISRTMSNSYHLSHLQDHSIKIVNRDSLRRDNMAAPVCSTKEQTPAFLRSNSERRAADHQIRIHQPTLPRNSDEHSFLVARAAAISGDLIYLKKLIAKNPILSNSVDHFGRTLLIYAALSGQTDCVQWLAAKDGGGGGADVRATDRDGMTAVHWAVHKGHHRTLKALLKKQVDGDPLAPDEEGATALHLAVKQPSTKCLDVIIDFLIKRDRLSAVIATVDNGGRSPLHWAAAAGRLQELLKHLKDKLKISFEEADDEGRTPLMWCVLSDSSASIPCLDLITQRAPRSVRAQDNNGYTALHLAVMVDNISAIEHFLECKLSNANMADHEGRTPLHWAGILGRPGASTLLIKAKTDANRRDNHGAMAVHYAAQCNYAETLKTMLRHCSEDPLDSEGRTCFMRAATNGAIDALMTILNITPSVDPEQRDQLGSTALHFAARNGQDATVKFLLDRGWSTDAMDNQGHTALLAAAEYGHASVLQLLLKSGAAAWHKDSNGRTALHWAALGGHAFVCQILIKQGISVDAADIGGRTAIHCAAFGGFFGCLSVLLQAGAHPCIPDNEGLIALHLAAAEGNLDVCKRLLDAGSLINAVYDDERGGRLTPYDTAVVNGRSDVADFLVENGAMTFEQLINAAATKVQACYRGYRVRKIWKRIKPATGPTLARLTTSSQPGMSRYIRKKN